MLVKQKQTVVTRAEKIHYDNQLVNRYNADVHSLLAAQTDL